MYPELLCDMVNACPPGSRELNDELYPRVTAGDKAAREQMILANMSLVISKVDFALQQQPTLEYLRSDMISAGFLGLTQSVDGMKDAVVDNPTGYLSVAIQNEINHLVDEETTVSVPWQTQSYERRRGNTKPLPEPVPQTLEDVAPLIPDHAAMIELRDVIAACCQNDVDRQIVRMREEDCTFEEIGWSLGISSSAACKRLQGIRERFQEACDDSN